MPAFDFVLAGRYRLLAPLGEGGMASVYRARDLRLNREVAVKILREDLTRDLEFLDRFGREAQFVASLSHPNIVPVYDVGEEKGSHFIVMEYVQGRTLKETLETGGPMPEERALTIMRSVLQALGYAHSRGLIHRDVKPHNILLRTNGAALLTDFGIAHLVGGSTTRTAAVLGSAHYLSPEQARGDEATPASDIYSCGIVLFEALTGHPPFDGPNALAIAHHHVYTDPPHPSDSADVSPRVESAVLRALSKDPARRFPSTDEFENALDGPKHDADATTVQSIVPHEQHQGGTEILPLISSDSVDLQQRDEPIDDPSVADGGFVLRRSARKTGVLGVLCAGVLVAAADVARLPFNGHTLPHYPSAPYALVPGVTLAALLLSWFHVRSWKYHMDSNAAVMQWGLLSHHRFGVPVRYITTLELKQSLIDRLLGVGTVELCARDQHGKERRLVLEDLPHPRQSYDELMRFLGRTVRSRPHLPPRQN